MAKPYVTLEQARLMLPRVRKLLEGMIELNKTIALLSEAELSFDDAYDELKADLRLNKELHRFSVELFAGLEQLADMGCIVKDLEIGLLDFYAEFEGREVFLCWKLDEEDIGYWHEVEQGFDDRKLILELEEKNRT